MKDAAEPVPNLRSRANARIPPAAFERRTGGTIPVLRTVTQVRRARESLENPKILWTCYAIPPNLGMAEGGSYPIRRYIIVTLLLTHAQGLTWLARVYFEVTT